MPFSITLLAQTHLTSANAAAVAINPADHFVYSGKDVAFYGLGWYNEDINWPPYAYLSSFSGINFFTQGSSRVFIGGQGNLGINTVNPRNKLDLWGGKLSVTGDDYNGTAVLGASGGISYFGSEYLNNGIAISPAGNVGVATSTPRATFDNAKFVSAGGLATVMARLQEGDYAGEGTFLGVRGFETQNQAFQNKSFALEHNFYGVTNSAINFYRGGSVTGGYLTFSTYHNIERMRIDRDGNVGIGLANPSERLTVNGKVKAREIRVDASNMPDYVFEQKYWNMPLPKLEKYLQINKHLPGIPSAQEFQQNGLELGEMSKLLLKKIEELTLHVIEQDKQIRLQGKEINRLKKNKR